MSRLRYARGWEDPAVLRGALAAGPGDDVLSIAAAGDNSLSVLLDDPASVEALDRDGPQLHLVALKLGCLRALPRDEALALLGERPAATGQRAALFERVVPHLPEDAASFWRGAAPRRWIEEGLGGCGRFERYLALFRRRVLPLIHRRATVDALLGLEDLDAQRALYATRWDSRRWRLLFRLFFGERVMRRLGRDPAFFAHVDTPHIGDVFRGRVARVLTTLPVRANPFIAWILTGRLDREALRPPWLRAGNYEIVAARADRLRLRQADLGARLDAAPPGAWSAFNLSNLFEYLSAEQATALFGRLARAARPGARLAWWELLVPRPRPPSLAPLLAAHPDRAAALFATDRAPFYGAFHLATRTDAPC